MTTSEGEPMPPIGPPPGDRPPSPAAARPKALLPGLPVIGLVAALPEEVGPLRRALAGRSVVRTGEWRFDQGLLGAAVGAARVPAHAGTGSAGELPSNDVRRRDGQPRQARVILVRSGMGRDRAARACAALLDHFPLACVAAVGFAGALSRELSPGALLWADVVLAISDHEWATTTAGSDCLSPPAAVRRVAHVGPLVTTDRVLCRAAAKEELARRCSVPSPERCSGLSEPGTGGRRPLAVDMEAAGVAEVAAARGVPFAAVRVVTDALEHDLPLDFNRCIGPRGDMRGVSLAAQLACRPRALPGLLRLGHHSLFAARRLAAFLAVALPQLM